MTTINDIRDLANILEEHPEWRGELRRLLLTDDLLEMPIRMTKLEDRVDVLTARVDDLAAIVKDLTITVNALTIKVDKLADKVDKLADTVSVLMDMAIATNKRLDALETRFDRFEASVETRFDGVDGRFDRFEASVETRFDGVETRFDGVDGRFDRFEASVDRRFDRFRGEMNQRFNRIEASIGDLKGHFMQGKAREDAYAIATRMNLEWVATPPKGIAIKIWREAESSGLTESIDRDDRISFQGADLIIEALTPYGERCYIPVEASFTANGRDTRRVVRNAEYLSRFTGLPSFPVVASVRIDNRVRDLVADYEEWTDDSQKIFWYRLEDVTAPT